MQWTALLLKQFWFIHLRLFLQKSIQINSDHWYRLDQLGSTQKRNETREKIIVRLEVKIYPKVTWNKPNQVNYDLLLLSVKLPSALGILFFQSFAEKNVLALTGDHLCEVSTTLQCSCPVTGWTEFPSNIYPQRNGTGGKVRLCHGVLHASSN